MRNYNSSVIRQKGESQNECFKKTKHAKFSEKRTFLTPWHAHILNNFQEIIFNGFNSAGISEAVTKASMIFDEVENPLREV